MDFGSQQCLVSTECRNIIEGIAQGDFQNIVLNAGVLAFTVSSMGSASSGKAMQTIGMSSSSAQAMNLGGALAFNSTINGGINSNS